MDSPVILKRKTPFPFLSKEVTRHGQTIYYFRRGRGRRVRIPGEYGDDDFRAAYALAFDGKLLPPELKPKAVFDRNHKRAVGLAVEEAVSRASKRGAKFGREFSISYDWAINQIEAQDFKCALTGIPFFMRVSGEWGRHPFAPSIDRINSSKGYVEGNCRVVAVAVNIALADWGEDVFRRIAEGYVAQKKASRR